MTRTAKSNPCHDTQYISNNIDTSMLNPNNYPLTLLSEENLAEKLEANKLLCTYYKRLLSVTEFPPYSKALPILLDKAGCILCTNEFLKDETNPLNGMFKPGAVFQMNQCGPNAITIGCLKQQCCRSEGKDNFNNQFKEFTIYYAPIQAYQSNPTFVNWIDAGIALISPKKEKTPLYNYLIKLMAHDLVLNLHANQMAFSIWTGIGRETLSISTQASPTEPIISHCDNSFFTTFHLKHTNILQQPAAIIFDPLPENKKFWAILQDMTTINSENITLKMQGVSHACTISTRSYNQPQLHIKGMDFVIATQKQLTNEIAAKTTNSAIVTFSDIIGSSPATMSVINKAKAYADTDLNIMILGESGTGKDIFAQAIHNASKRRNKPFIAINCAGIPRELIASELFGYESGAFTGAKKQGNIGKFELADGGTIFLDEIGELPLDLQATLLRVVEQKQFMRLGGNSMIHTDTKIISATNANISDMVQKKQFREDLYYRLSAMQLNLPPLRQRGNDIILLAKHFIQTVSNRLGRYRIQELSVSAQNLLMNLPWHGNVRELRNLIELLIQLYPSSTILDSDVIMDNIYSYNSVATPQAYPHDNELLPVNSEYNTDAYILKKHIILDKKALYEAIIRCGGNRSKAAKYLGISRKTLYRYLEKYSK